jgi:hypothetical protein
LLADDQVDIDAHPLAPVLFVLADADRPRQYKIAYDDAVAGCRLLGFCGIRDRSLRGAFPVMCCPQICCSVTLAVSDISFADPMGQAGGDAARGCRKETQRLPYPLCCAIEMPAFAVSEWTDVSSRKLFLGIALLRHGHP